jgi:TRAP transporter 4TM/12TM fusion protein
MSPLRGPWPIGRQMKNQLLNLIYDANEDNDDLKKDFFPSGQRRPGGTFGLLTTIICSGLFLLTLLWAYDDPWNPYVQRAIHLMIMVSLAILLYPIRKTGKDANGNEDLGRPGAFDILLAVVAVAAFAYTIWHGDRITERIPYFDEVTLADAVVGTLCVITIFEATRRTVGMSIVWLNAFFLLYAVSGPYWPGVFQHRGVDYVDLVESIYLLPGGIFNFITGLMATFIFVFLALGVFLRASRCDSVFTDIALSLAGSRRGGPAKVAVISSALMGMLSGSSIGNVVTTGAMTIPMMKKVGFRPYEAAAIETTASVGGVLTPPIMGATVFILAEFTGVELVTILAYSVIPAVLYFVSLYFYVDIKAGKRGLEGLTKDQLPVFWQVIKSGGHVFIPILVLIVLLVLGYTPFWAGASCVIATVFTSYLRKHTRITLRRIVIAMEASTRVTMTLSALGASAAIIYAVLTITGLLVKASSIILALAGGSLFIGIILIALMSYVLGMSLPVTAAYVLIASLGAPALEELGVSLFTAHLIILWFSQDSTITPPICMTAFVAARVADAPPMKTGFQSVLMAKALYIIPFVFAYGSLLDESVLEILFDAGALFILFAAMPMVVEGFWARKLRVLERILLGGSAVLGYVATIGPMADGWMWFVAALLTMGGTATLAVRTRNSSLSAPP